MRAEYAYVVDSAGRITDAASTQWSTAGDIDVNGFGRTTWLGPFGVAARDLLRVVGAIHAVDRLSPRRPLRAAAGPLAWQRTIRLTVDVEDPDRWSSARDTLVELLHFMTDDAWEIDFAHGSPVPSQGDLRLDDGPVSRVALFSGGLDSVAGLHVRTKEVGPHILAVTVSGNTVQRAARAKAFETVKDLSGVQRRIGVSFQLRHPSLPEQRHEKSQRTRCLLFLAAGAAVASQLDVRDVEVYETGVGAINLPMSAAQVGSQGTRGLHPRTIALVASLVAQVLGPSVRVVMPFFDLTKGELCRRVGEHLCALVATSRSCDRGERRRRNDLPAHCGLCTSCLFRRIALHAAGMANDVERYRDQPTKSHGRFEVALFEEHAARLLECKTFDDLARIDPDLRLGVRAFPACAMSEREARASVVDLHRRYAVEVQSYFGQSGPRLSRAVVRASGMRKHRVADLLPALG